MGDPNYMGSDFSPLASSKMSYWWSALKLPRNNTKCLSTKAFKEMKKLRLLQLAGVQLVGDFKYLSKDLRWLCWHGFPLACIPTNLYQGSLVSIELENSNVNLLWKEAQVLI